MGNSIIDQQRDNKDFLFMSPSWLPEIGFRINFAAAGKLKHIPVFYTDPVDPEERIERAFKLLQQFFDDDKRMIRSNPDYWTENNE